MEEMLECLNRLYQSAWRRMDYSLCLKIEQRRAMLLGLEP